MEPQVLEIEPVPVKVRRKQRVISVTLQIAIWVFLMFIWQYLSHRSSDRTYGWVDLLISCVFGGLIYGLLLYFLPYRGKKAASARRRITVERDHVALSYQSSEGSSWIPQMVVRKDKIRSIFKILNGIGVSERSQFGARMLGFMPIPNTLPKFDKLRTLLATWQVANASSLPKH